MREQLLDRMIKIYGFEHEIVIDFARMCESDNFTDKDLEMVVDFAARMCESDNFTDKDLEIVVEAHEASPVGFDEDEDF